MLFSADNTIRDTGYGDLTGGWETAPAQATHGGGFQAVPGERSRYRQRKWDAKSVVLVIAVQGALGAMLLSLRPDIGHVLPEPSLQTFDVIVPTASPPPPPAEPQPQSAAVQSPIAAPDPVVKLPAPAPMVQAVALPRPALQPVAFSPKAAPAPAPPAPPAPVTPPSFDAAQLSNPAPRYPYLARRAHEEGVVMLRVLVTAQGKAKTLRIESSSGSSRLDDAALKTVRRWDFVPANQAGKPVEAWVLVPVTFSLG